MRKTSFSSSIGDKKSPICVDVEIDPEQKWSYRITVHQNGKEKDQFRTESKPDSQDVSDFLMQYSVGELSTSVFKWIIQANPQQSELP